MQSSHRKQLSQWRTSCKVSHSKTKKVTFSLRFRVSSLRRDHANLLCILKRLFKDPATRTEPNESDILKYIKRCVCLLFGNHSFFVPTAGVRPKYEATAQTILLAREEECCTACRPQGASHHTSNFLSCKQPAGNVHHHYRVGAPSQGKACHASLG